MLSLTSEHRQQGGGGFVKVTRVSCAAAALIGLGGALIAATTSAQAGTPPPERVGARPLVPSTARQIGLLASSTVLRLDVTLKVRDQAALTSYIADLSNRQSPLFDHFLRAGQFGPMFGATLAQVAAVDSALRSAGLVPGQVSADRLSIPVRASAAAAEHAFATTLVSYRLASGRVAYANTQAPRISGAAAPYVSGVLGLSNLVTVQSQAARPDAVLRPGGAIKSAIHRFLTARPAAAAASGPQPCSTAVTAAGSFGSLTANEFAAGYGMTPLYGLGDLGQGVRIALIEFEPNSASDVSSYLSCYGITTPVNYVTVDGGAGSGTGSGEAALDIEVAAGLAPDASIDVYQAPNGGDTDTYDNYAAAVNADKDQVISTSWAECELNADSSLITAETPVFEQAAAQGQTVFSAAGDEGSTACYSSGGSNANASTPAVNDPSSQPDVVAVGGTSVTTSGQVVWNDSAIDGGAGGGGVSAVQCMPVYQHQTTIPGLINLDSQADSSCPTGFKRQVPDVSADADPETGYTIFYNGAWTAFGGTSAAAPLWAAVAAINDASPFCKDYSSGDAGVRPAGLYAVAAAVGSYIWTDGEVLTDITSGNNDYTPSGYTGGLYPATTGYDMASGLGTPVVSGYTSAGPSTFYPGLAALMCFAYGTKNTTTSISGISPSAGPAKRAATVTITGKGFLPIAGADVATVGSTAVVAKCTSSTKCTVRLPARSAGTVTIRMDVEAIAVSKATSATKYTYAAAPSISSLSPGSGSTRGGNKVTIRGHNFIGKLAVHFGKKAAKIVSHTSTKLVVIVPRGSGKVSVTVTAAGGKSKASHYRYV
jgi:subtilase family serine protease